jgi:hypothetical protein
VFSAFCVLVECVLNAGGLLVWEYPFWNRSFAGIWLIFLFGYFEFFAAISLVLGMGARAATEGVGRRLEGAPREWKDDLGWPCIERRAVPSNA